MLSRTTKLKKKRNIATSNEKLEIGKAANMTEEKNILKAER